MPGQPIVPPGDLRIAQRRLRLTSRLSVEQSELAGTGDGEATVAGMEGQGIRQRAQRQPLRSLSLLQIVNADGAVRMTERQPAAIGIEGQGERAEAIRLGEVDH